MATEKNGFRSKYPSRCGTDGQNMFLDKGHKFPGPPVAVCCALSPHLECNLTARERGKGDIRKKHAAVAENKLTLSRLCAQRQTGKGSGKGVSHLFPELRRTITPALPVSGH